MPDNIKPLGHRWFNLATDVCRTSIKTMVIFEERTLEVTSSLLRQVEVVHEQGQGLMRDFSDQVERGRVLVDETVERTKAIRAKNRELIRALKGEDDDVRRLPAPRYRYEDDDEDEDEE
jgi:hypothetical protein